MYNLPMTQDEQDLLKEALNSHGQLGMYKDKHAIASAGIAKSGIIYKEGETIFADDEVIEVAIYAVDSMQSHIVGDMFKFDAVGKLWEKLDSFTG